MIWTRERMEQLTALWDEGLPTREIGRRMGINKNQVIGKAHRLELKARAIGTPRKRPALIDERCCWVLGGFRGDKIQFCAQPAVAGKPYCAAHAARAYKAKGGDPDALGPADRIVQQPQKGKHVLHR